MRAPAAARKRRLARRLRDLFETFGAGRHGHWLKQYRRRLSRANLLWLIPLIVRQSVSRYTMPWT
ncbi:hypothetical protein BZM27_15545 [Paraburkholderia steynii]|uniref:Uncharacterized protein n=1 Tax=Paraburkholderia steynii TaxID=1245441 RepID=A0A4R0XJ03_9BURK|nr:hypothetical protein BZM27_15545 [Paraburkholderia steynii]